MSRLFSNTISVDINLKDYIEDIECFLEQNKDNEEIKEMIGKISTPSREIVKIINNIEYGFSTHVEAIDKIKHLIEYDKHKHEC